MGAAGTMAGTMAFPRMAGMATAQPPQTPAAGMAFPRMAGMATAQPPQTPQMPGPNVWNSANANISAGAIAL